VKILARYVVATLLLVLSAASAQDFEVYVVERATEAREKPGLIFKVVGKLRAGEEVLGDREESGWIHLSGGGWVPRDALRIKALSRLYEVTADKARIRRGPGTAHDILTTKTKGERLRIVEENSGWLKLEQGGWIFARLARPIHPSPAHDAPEPATGEVAQPGGEEEPPRRVLKVKAKEGPVAVREGPGKEHPQLGSLAQGEVVEAIESRLGWLRLAHGGWVPIEGVVPAEPITPAALMERMARLRKWGFLSLTGVYIKVIEVPERSLVARRIQDGLNRLTGQERDYTFLTIIIEVPPSATYRFNFSPEHNRIQLITRSGKKYANFVHTKGDLSRLPPEVRGLFEAKEVYPGYVETAFLAFSGEVKAQEIERVFLYVSSRMQELFEES
jgi:uncharacterized protein YgiM (DUF1202 family)